MKRLLICFLCMILNIVLLSGCSHYENEDEVVKSIGDCSKIGFFSSGDFQDFSDYAKYSVESPILENNSYFIQMDDTSKEALLIHIDNFAEWVELSKGYGSLYENYDFDKSIISSDDFLYIYDNPDYPELGCYYVYFFDIDTNVLYYFHNNI